MTVANSANTVLIFFILFTILDIIIFQRKLQYSISIFHTPAGHPLPSYSVSLRKRPFGPSTERPRELLTPAGPPLLRRGRGRFYHLSFVWMSSPQRWSFGKGLPFQAFTCVHSSAGQVQKSWSAGKPSGMNVSDAM